MICIIVGTNRPDSLSRKVANYYQKLLQNLGQESQILDLINLPKDFTFTSLAKNADKGEVFNEFQKIIDTTEKFVFIVPEYNGSFPGILKVFLDGLRYPDSLSNKKAALVGIAAGMLGNAVGLGHLDDILSYMGTNTLALRMKLGNIKQHFDGEEFSFNIYQNFLEKQAKQFIEF
jgi:chromate reductase